MFGETIDLERIRAAPDDPRITLSFLVAAYAGAGRKTEAMRTLSELQHLAEREHVDPGYFIVSYLGLGDEATI